MTDNRTTELLRKLLDERGVKYSDFTSATKNGKAIFKTRWKHECGYAELSEWESTGSNNLFIQNVDTEQAIAATLGNARAERGTLTADDIRDLIERHSDESGGNGRNFHNGAYVAIADELNARAERTCEIESSYLNDFTVKNMCWYEFEMKCGYKFTWDVMEPPKFCPNCGGEVKGADA